MKIFNEIKNVVYQAKTDKLLYFEKLYRMLDKCYALGVFNNTKTATFGEHVLDDKTLYGFREKGAVVNGVTMKETLYLFYGNVCLVCSNNGMDRIIKIKVKEPDGEWKIDVSNQGEYDELRHLHFLNKSIDVYCWWDVDWMGFGKRDYNVVSKSGSWWKYIYEDVCGIYESVEEKGEDYLFNKKFK